jgi:putative YhdH/YhfP family quinone oxidoreductase
MHSTQFQALVVAKNDDGSYTRSLQWKTLSDLPEGEIVIKVDYSSLNYKDALSASGNHGVTRRYPHTPGIDAAGRVHSSTVEEEFSPGDPVLCMGYDLGMNTFGAFSRYISVPAAWVMPLPSGLTTLESMQIGTAGFTAAQCIHRLIELGVTPDKGSVLVTGATGGVGSLAVRLLASLQYKVTAVTGKLDQHQFLYAIGADKIINRDKFLRGRGKLLLRGRWAGVVDTVGGEYLATAIKGTCYDGVVTSCGNAASGDLPLNVYPFILRGVTLSGIDSAQCRMERRKIIWDYLAGSWRFSGLSSMCRTVILSQLDSEIDMMLKGGSKGRVVVDLQEKI